MVNPYRGRPAYTFWQQGVKDAALTGVDPVVKGAFSIGPKDAIATAGSCFAQNIARTLVRQGYNYFVTEGYAAAAGVVDENYGVFPARFGNLYTAKQLLQSFDRAYGAFHPKVDAWVGRRGSVIDPFRPRIQENGFGSIDNLHADRVRHFAAVRRMFEECKVFIFTLELTEAWVSTVDGSVFPLAPGVVSDNDDARFQNYGVGEIVDDMVAFLDRLRDVNPTAKVILTVSPVPLIATYEDRHVLVSTIASKSILRAAVEEIIRRKPEVAYFPSYEIVTGPQTAGRFYKSDLREITPEGVAYIMSLFSRHYLADEQPEPLTAEKAAPAEESSLGLSEEDERRFAGIAAIVCDEKAIVQ